MKNLQFNLIREIAGARLFETNCIKENITDFIYEDAPLCYFKHRESNQEILAYGKSQIIIQAISNSLPLDFNWFHLNTFNGRDGKNEWSFLQASEYIAPKLQFINTEKGLKAYLLLVDPQERPEQFNLNDEHSLKSSINRGVKKISNLNKSQWNDLLQNALTKIDQRIFDKVVLSRRESVKSTEVSRSSLISKLRNQQKRNYIFLYSPTSEICYISLTPERLFRRESNQIEIDILAGTKKRDSDEDLHSDKILLEHRLVRNEVETKLKEISKKIQALNVEEELELKHIAHLKTEIKATLENGVSVERILELLHPTPAVGGSPWISAKAFLDEKEANERGLYAAPIGILNRDSSEYIVGIRSALITDDYTHLYAGAGIVQGSIPEKEWEETSNKLKTVGDLL